MLVITTVVAIFAFAGIWYLRPGVPNELLEQARARQLQPLLEIEAPIRKPVAEPVAQSSVDKKALAEELLPSLTDQVARSLEGPLYEKLKKELALDEDFVTQLSAILGDTFNLGDQTSDTGSAPVIPQGLQADFTRQVEALRTELLATFGEGQSSFFFQIEGMLDARLQRVEDDLKAEMQTYVPQLVDRMIPSLVEMLVSELDANKATYLPYLAQELPPQVRESITEEELVLIYTSYRDQIVADLVPSILAAMEEPAKAEVAQMVEAVTTPSTAVVVPAPSVVTNVVTPVAETKTVPLEPMVEAKPVVTPQVAVEPEVVMPAPVVPEPPSVVAETKAGIPKAPSVLTATSMVQKIEPVLAAPTFVTEGPEVFLDPVVYEEKRTEIRTKAIQEVLDRINAL